MTPKRDSANPGGGSESGSVFKVRLTIEVRSEGGEVKFIVHQPEDERALNRLLEIWDSKQPGYWKAPLQGGVAEWLSDADQAKSCGRNSGDGGGNQTVVWQAQ